MLSVSLKKNYTQVAEAAALASISLSLFNITVKKQSFRHRHYHFLVSPLTLDFVSSVAQNDKLLARDREFNAHMGFVLLR